jgi:hypothetical protein
VPNTGHRWSKKEDDWLRARLKDKPLTQSYDDYARQLERETRGGLSWGAIRARAKDMRKGVISQSTYPVYDSPLEMTGDALILTDVEFPFHHADFLNACLGLASTWGIRQLILGGDALHFDSLSGWEPSWSDTQDGGLGEAAQDALYEFMRGLPRTQQAAGEAILDKLGEAQAQHGASAELEVARRELHRIGDRFDRVDFVLGNHEGRFLRAMSTAVDPKELLRLLDIQEGKWRISPYYFSILYSSGQRFQVEHPKNTAKFSAGKLASKYASHVIQGHSHQLSFAFDVSGKFYAIETGHCVDESRLPYASQRHNTAAAHVLGACIVRDGHPWLLHQYTPFDELAKMV